MQINPADLRFPLVIQAEPEPRKATLLIRQHKVSRLRFATSLLAQEFLFERKESHQAPREATQQQVCDRLGIRVPLDHRQPVTLLACGTQHDQRRPRGSHRGQTWEHAEQRSEPGEESFHVRSDLCHMECRSANTGAKRFQPALFRGAIPHCLPPRHRGHRVIQLCFTSRTISG